MALSVLPCVLITSTEKIFSSTAGAGRRSNMVRRMEKEKKNHICASSLWMNVGPWGNKKQQVLWGEKHSLPKIPTMMVTIIALR